jgi:sulfur-oxidizing protein SoxX
MRILTTAIAALLVVGVAQAEPVAPSDVMFEEGAVPVSLTGAPGDPVAGREVMIARGLGNCVACHMAEAYADVPFQGNVGPPLDGVGERWSESELRGIVSNAKMMFDGTIMPSFYKNSGYIRPGNAFTGKAAEGELPPLLTAEQVEDVVAYLMTIK